MTAVDGDVAVPVAPISRRPVQIRELHVWGTTLRVGVWPGSAARPPLLLFNGIGASLELFGAFADALEDVELIAYDMPGTGESGMPPIPYRLWMLALMTDQLLDQLGYDRVDTLGVSWGGGIAQQFALQNPRRCRRLVLAATCAGVTMIPPKPSVLAKFITPRRFNDHTYLESVADEIYGESPVAAPGAPADADPRRLRRSDRPPRQRRRARLGDPRQPQASVRRRPPVPDH
jgi:poly(3-hydroxyoctanoate) depolymerase